jgi:hypothetical protein
VAGAEAGLAEETAVTGASALPEVT